MRFVKGLLCAATCGWALTVGAAETGAGAIDAEVDAELDALLDVGRPAGETGSQGLRLKGYAELGGAYTFADPEHWSKLRARLELGANGRLGERVKWKLSARADADGAFDLEDGHYPGPVRHDQRKDFSIREAYMDFGAGDWEFRLGRQHIVWGEMVGFFFADVVSARDLREFLLPEFEGLRIPQWAARAEFYGGENHFELVWVPVPSYDEIGKPGGDFYPFPGIPGGTPVSERKPAHGLSKGNWGLRASRLVDGWDLSAFYYRSYDVSPTLSLAPGGFELRHDRISQVGGTFSKDMGSFVLKGEAVHSHGRSLNTVVGTTLGLAATDMVDYAIGVDIPVQRVWRFNLQYFGRWLEDHVPAMQTDRDEHGLTFQVVRELGSEFEAELLAAASLNRNDYMLRPKLTWKFAPEWRAVTGLDVFKGKTNGLFGRFDDSDRVYVEVRRWF